MGLRQVRPLRTTLSVASGGTTSEVLRVEGFDRGSIRTPSALTSTAATWQVSSDGTNFAALKTSAGAAFGNVTVAANVDVPIPDGVFSFPFVKLVLGSAEGAARTISVTLY